MTTIASQLREMLPTWAFAVLLPAPMATFWGVGPGRDFAYAYFFLGCSLLVAERFQQAGESDPFASEGEDLRVLWRLRMVSLSVAILAAIAVFTTFAWAIAGEFNVATPLLAILASVPALCCVPCLVLLTGQRYGAILLVVFFLGLVKLAGCVIVRIVDGPDALALGRMTLPWTEPNLLVWLCLAGMLCLSVLCAFWGRRRFLQGEKQLNLVTVR